MRLLWIPIVVASFRVKHLFIRKSLGILFLEFAQKPRSLPLGCAGSCICDSTRVPVDGPHEPTIHGYRVKISIQVIEERTKLGAKDDRAGKSLSHRFTTNSQASSLPGRRFRYVVSGVLFHKRLCLLLARKCLDNILIFINDIKFTYLRAILKLLEIPHCNLLLHELSHLLDGRFWILLITKVTQHVLEQHHMLGHSIFSLPLEAVLRIDLTSLFPM